MRDRLQVSAGAEVTLIEGDSGVFEITKGDQLVFSKKALNRFPEDSEVDALLV